MKKEQKTIACFMKEKESGDILVVFPELESPKANLIEAFAASEGQHTAVDEDYILNSTQSITEADLEKDNALRVKYDEAKNTLEQDYGYSLVSVVYPQLTCHIPSTLSPVFICDTMNKEGVFPGM